MNQTTIYTRQLSRAWHTIVLFGMAGLLLALVVSFIQPLKYSSSVRLLVLQQGSDNLDAFTASRSEERLAENLATIIYTTTFFDQVLTSGFDIDPALFPESDRKRRKAWEKTIDATVARGTGLLTISSYHQDIAQAEQIARAVSFVLGGQAGEFTSGRTQVRLIDAPLNSRWPVKPNILTNIVSGFFLGIFVGVAYVLWHIERLRTRHQLIHEEF